MASYLTRYLATIKERIAILVTFSAHQSHYTKYSNDFFNVILSLRVVADSKMLSNPGGPGVRPGSGEILGGNQNPGIPEAFGDGELPEAGSGSGMTKEKLAMLALIVVAVALIILLRARRKR